MTARRNETKKPFVSGNRRTQVKLIISVEKFILVFKVRN